MPITDYDTGGLPNLALDYHYSGPIAFVLLVLEVIFWLFVGRGIVKKVKKQGKE